MVTANLNNMETSPELPGWVFIVDEISAGTL
jgi:hypothetical protein